MTPPATPPTDRFVYRIATHEEWQIAQADGFFRGRDHDTRDGFLHLSRRAQLDSTLKVHYPDRAGLVLLEIDAATIGADLRYEPSRKGELFPHLFAALPVSAVRKVAPVPLDGPIFSESAP